MDITQLQLLIVCCAAFAAGFVDAVVGGGGLVQLPLTLITFPNFPVASVVASLKLPSFTGTAIAARQYLKKVRVQWPVVVVLGIIAFVGSFLGSRLLTQVGNDFMKPVLLVVLSAVAVYTFIKKNLGAASGLSVPKTVLLLRGGLICAGVGFYDGFIGPGTGSFFMLLFVALLHFDFLHASAYARLINMATNAASLIYFVAKGIIIWKLALPMAAANAAGGYLGAQVATRRGNAFIRKVFLFVVLAILARFAWDVFKG